LIRFLVGKPSYSNARRSLSAFSLQQPGPDAKIKTATARSSNRSMKPDDETGR